MAFAALLLGMLMAALDTNVVVAALPSLTESLGQPAAVAGVTAAYLLAVAVATPLHGSLGDRWGRRSMFIASIVVFGLGSMACAAASSMPALIAFRAVQGLGGSGLIVAAVSAMAELFDREQMVRRQGWLTAMSAVSSIGGAPLGGFLAAGPGWEWIFLVNLPVCVVALGLGAWSVPGPRDTASSAGPRFDVAGAALVTAAGASVVLLGSSDTLARSWVWAPTLLLIAAVAVAVLLRVERRAASPLLPPRIFADPGLARSIMVTLAAGVALFGTFTFVPLAIVSGGGDNRPEFTGLLLLPMSVGQLAVTTGFAVLARRWPAITVWGRVGLGLGVVGLLGIASVPLLEPGLIRTGMTIAGLGA